MTLQQRRVLSGFRAIPLAILALLFVSCASLTPERVQVLAQIAGAAAQLGAQEWLAKHPDHRAAFDLVVAEIRRLVNQGVIDPAKYAKALDSLPPGLYLTGPEGDLMWSGSSPTGYLPARLFVWDGKLKKTVPLTGPEVLPVMKQATAGLKRATVPPPPALPARVKRIHEVHVTNVVVHHWTNVIHEPFPYFHTNYYLTNINVGIGGVVPVAEVNDAALDAEFQQYLAAKAKTNGALKRIRVFRPGMTNGYEAVPVK